MASQRGPSRRSVASAPGAPSTPHAIRALEHRAASIAMQGQKRRQSGRRQSGRQERETPRDILRRLSRVLPKLSTAAKVQDPPRSGSRFLLPEDDLDAEVDLTPPRLSMPLDEDDEDDEDDDPSFYAPSSRFLDDDGLTLRSIEHPRRAYAQGHDRDSRYSLRTSDGFADIGDLGSEVGADLDTDDTNVGVGVENRDDGRDEGADDRTGNLQTVVRDRTSLMQQPEEREVALDDISFTLEIPAHLEGLPEHTGTLKVSRAISLARVREGQNQDREQEQEAVESIVQPSGEEAAARECVRTRKKKRPAVPVGVVKKFAASFIKSSGSKKAKIGKETLGAIMQASDWFFEQVSEDLGVFARHACRKTVDEADVLTLMKRQRLLTATTTPFSLAQNFLPRELLQDIRMTPPQPLR